MKWLLLISLIACASKPLPVKEEPRATDQEIETILVPDPKVDKQVRSLFEKVRVKVKKKKRRK